MKVVCLALVCLFSGSALAGDSFVIEPGSASISCSHQSRSIPESYSVSVFAKNGKGTALLSKGGEVILIDSVSTENSSSTFALIEGSKLELAVDSEDNLTGQLSFSLNGDKTEVTFGELECSFIPKGIGR